MEIITQESYVTDPEQEINMAADYIIRCADCHDRALIADYGRCLAVNENNVQVSVNGIAALFRSGVIEMAAYRKLSDTEWEALERAIAMSVFNRMEES